MTFSGTGESALSKCSGIFSRCAVCVLCIAFACGAQAMQAPGTLPSGSQGRGATKVAPPAPRRSKSARRRRKEAVPKKPVKPPYPSDSAARPATVRLQNGKLTVEANNSDLTQILQDIAHISGMTIDGLDKNTRVFGAYGPGNPRDVLTHLLVGSGYNFIMAGNTTDGAPRELLLTARNQNNSAPALTPANPPPTAAAAAEDSQQRPEPEVQQPEPDASTTDEVSPDSPADSQVDPQINPQNTPEGAETPQEPEPQLDVPQ